MATSAGDDRWAAAPRASISLVLVTKGDMQIRLVRGECVLLVGGA